jgi:hypothetical protein
MAAPSTNQFFFASAPDMELASLIAYAKRCGDLP